MRNASRATSTIKQGAIYGHDEEREREREQLVKMLLHSGVGKTTLAHYVYGDKRVEKYFHARVWICASDDINVMRISGVILGPPPTNRANEFSQLGIGKLDFLEMILKEELEGKRFLLVLDDVESIEWTTRFAAIKSGQKGSKIVLTARAEEVVDEEAKKEQNCFGGFKRG